MVCLDVRDWFRAVAVALLVAAAALVGLGFLQHAAGAEAARHWIHLPIIRQAYPPYPAQPTLLGIDNADGDGNYWVGWSVAPRAQRYELEEQWQGGNWYRVYEGTGVQVELRNRPAGDYAYRCRAWNTLGESPWSNVQGVKVQGTAPGTISTPPSSSTSAGGKAVIKVVNDCPYALSLDFSGPSPTVMQLPKCDVCKVYSFIGPIFCPTTNRPTQEWQIEPGPYRVIASVPDPSIPAFVGHWTLQGNRRYTVCFYILKTWAAPEASPTVKLIVTSCEP